VSVEMTVQQKLAKTDVRNSPRSGGCQHVCLGARPPREQRVTRRRAVFFAFAVTSRRHHLHVRHLVAFATSAAPFAKIVDDQLGVRPGTQPTAPSRFRVVAEPVRRPVRVSVAALAFRARHRRRSFLVRSF